jgi:N-acetylneuraminic acid mutarotase
MKSTSSLQGLPAKLGLLALVGCLSCSEPPVVPFPENEDWLDLARLPEPKADFGVASYRGGLYVVGGWTNEYVATRTVFRYDADDDSWERLANFPFEIADLALVVSRDTLFAVGGVRATIGHPIRMLRAYDPATDTWADRPPILDERAGHATVELNGTIFLLGGPMNEASSHGPRVPGDSVLEYDVESSTWMYREPMQTPRYGVVAVRDSERFHTIGGLLLDTGLPSDEIETYDPATQGWQSLTVDPYTTQQPANALLNEEIHLIGGSLTSNSTTHRTFSLLDQTWEIRGEMWAPIIAARAVIHRGELYLLGGRVERTMLNRVLVYRPQ